MRPLWLAGAAALAIFLVLWRRRLSRSWLAGTALATVVVALVGLGVIPIPNLVKLIEDVGTALGPWTYLFVGLLAFLETGAFIGLVAPGETAVIVGGVVAGQGEISLFVLIAIVWTCAVAGDLCSYALGRRLGRGFLERHGPRVKITEARLQQVEAFFERRGGVTILVGRFIGLVRAIAPFIAGSSRMPLRTFVPYDVLGAGLWAGLFCTLGYLFWRSLDQLTAYVGRGLVVFGIVVALVLAVLAVRRLQRDPEARAWLDEQLDKPALRPLGRVARPAWHRVLAPAGRRLARPAHFVRERVTPGELGLEFTTQLALLAVGSFAFFFLGELRLEGDSLRIDTWAATAARRAYAGPAVEAVKVVTVLGSSFFTAAAVLVTAAWAVRRRGASDAIVLTVSWALTFALVHVAKAAYGEPRPPGAYVDTIGDAYPSGHAAYSVALVACAVVLVRRGSTMALRFAAVSVALAAVVVVGLSRVYLRAHYLSDVLGGIALGTAIFALVGCASLVVGYLRENAVPVRV